MRSCLVKLDALIVFLAITYIHVLDVRATEARLVCASVEADMGIRCSFILE